MEEPKRVWGRELAIEALNLNLLRLNRRLLALNLHLLKMNAELLKKNADTPLKRRLLRRLRALRLDAVRRLRKASTGAEGAVDDPGLLLLKAEVADLMRFLEEIQRAELLRRTGG